ncbi:MAG TPA: hypothetical protein VKA49_15390 [Flavitalea sp.]|nr:hypothetical protein [Flavitalea sp.]
MSTDPLFGEFQPQRNNTTIAFFQIISRWSNLYYDTARMTN